MADLKISKSTKSLKVYAKIRTTSKEPLGFRVVPEIKFSGQWLQHLGFEVGADLSVVVEDGIMTIKPN